MEPTQPQQINIKITDEIMEGRYANMMQVMHAKEDVEITGGKEKGRLILM